MKKERVWPVKGKRDQVHDLGLVYTGRAVQAERIETRS